MTESISTTYVKAILAGICISIGCIVFLHVGGGTLGAFLFSIGLILVCLNKFNLFTGAICYVEPTRRDVIEMVAILIGNMLGCISMAALTGWINPTMRETASRIVQVKLEEGLSVFFLGMLCNVLIFFAVNYCKYKVVLIGRTDSIIVIILCVMVFILSGSEHSIANTFYLALSRDLYTWGGLKYLCLNILGNAVGGIFIYQVVRATKC